MQVQLKQRIMIFRKRQQAAAGHAKAQGMIGMVFGLAANAVRSFRLSFFGPGGGGGAAVGSSGSGGRLSMRHFCEEETGTAATWHLFRRCDRITVLLFAVHVCFCVSSGFGPGMGGTPRGRISTCDHSAPCPPLESRPKSMWHPCPPHLGQGKAWTRGARRAQHHSSHSSVRFGIVVLSHTTFPMPSI